MATVAWWHRVTPGVQEWLIDNNGDSVPAEIAVHIRAAGGDVTVDEPLPDDVVDWIEAVANGESPDSTGEVPAANRFRITLEQLESGVHIPADQQVGSHSVERPPASTYEDEAQRQLRLAGGA